ncbi:hypothetical protein ACOMHN_039640 [Nucella lapillus]
MATAAPVEKDTMQINCCACSEVFVEPKILPCGHLVCRQCLISWLQTETEARCPVCTYPIVDGQVTCVDDVVDRFPTHLLMADIVKQASLLSKHHVCCVCEDIAAVSLCLTCGDMFCETCCKVHKKQSATRHHQLERLSSLTADTLAAKKTSMCPIHTNEQAQLFCPTHKVPVCVVCATADHRNCPYMVKAENRAQESLDVLTEVAVTLKAGEGKLETAIKEIEENLQALGRQTDKEISDVKAVQQRLEKAVQACCSRLMEKTLKRSANSQTSQLDGRAKLQAEKGRYVQHSTVVEQLGTFSVHTYFSDMAETMKKCADSLDCSDAFIASATVTDKSVTTLDYAAVVHIEEELARISEETVDAINSIYSYTCVGVVTCSPDTFHIPDCALLSDSPSVLYVTQGVGRAFGQKLDKEWPALEEIAEGSRVGLVLDSSRSLHLYVNGQDQGVITSGLPHPCYFMFDLCCRCVKNQSEPMSGGMGSEPMSGGMGSEPMSGGMGSEPMSGGMGSEPMSGGMGSEPMSGGMGSEPVRTNVWRNGVRTNVWRNGVRTSQNQCLEEWGQNQCLEEWGQNQCLEEWGQNQCLEEWGQNQCLEEWGQNQCLEEWGQNQCLEEWGQNQCLEEWGQNQCLEEWGQNQCLEEWGQNQSEPMSGGMGSDPMSGGMGSEPVRTNVWRNGVRTSQNQCLEEWGQNQSEPMSGGMGSEPVRTNVWRNGVRTSQNQCLEEWGDRQQVVPHGGSVGAKFSLPTF